MRTIFVGLAFGIVTAIAVCAQVTVEVVLEQRQFLPGNRCRWRCGWSITRDRPCTADDGGW